MVAGYHAPQPLPATRFSSSAMLCVGFVADVVEITPRCTSPTGTVQQNGVTAAWHGGVLFASLRPVQSAIGLTHCNNQRKRISIVLRLLHCGPPHPVHPETDPLYKELKTDEPVRRT